MGYIFKGLQEVWTCIFWIWTSIADCIPKAPYTVHILIGQGTGYPSSTTMPEAGVVILFQSERYKVLSAVTDNSTL